MTPTAEPLVSIILPVLNGSRFLRECLDSVFSQTFRSFEVIVIDDGSTDHTAVIAAEYAVTLIRQANQGQAVARNRGAAIARGRYLAFLDHDDYWNPRRLEAAVAALEGRPECALTYSDVDVMDEQSNVTQHALLAHFGDHPKRSLRHCLERDLYFVPSSVTVRRSVFSELGGFDESLRGYEDEEFCVRLFKQAPVYFIPETLVKWRQHPAGTSRSRHFLKSRIGYLRKLLAMFPDRPEAGEYLASRSIAPRFFVYYRDDYLSALDRRGPDIAPDELRRGILLTLSYMPRQPLSIWLLAHTPFWLTQTYRQIKQHLQLRPWLRQLVRRSWQRR